MIYFNDSPSKISSREIEGFPMIRFDANNFVLEEALYDGNYGIFHASAQGIGSSRERCEAFFKGFHADKSRFESFEIEIDGMVLRNKYEFLGQSTEITAEGFELNKLSLLFKMKNVKVVVCTLLDGSEFLTRWLEIENVGENEFVVTGLFPMAGILFPEIRGNTFSAEHLRAEYQLGSFLDNHYLAEGEFFWQNIPKGTLKFTYERAIFNPPFYMIRDNLYSQTAVISIESSAMIQAEFTRGGDYMYARHVSNSDYVHFKVGSERRATYRTIKPGAVVISPKIHFGLVYGSADNATNALNFHVRKSVIPKRDNNIIFPIEYNHTSYTECCQITKEKLKKEVDIAAFIGAEVFVLDAGWFGDSAKGWWQNRGDWREQDLLENGLLEIFDYARQKGLMCGMWMEAEGINFDTSLAKAHPNWFISAYGKPLETINLLIPAARNYVYNSINSIIEKYKLDLFRIDGGLKEPCEEYRENHIEGTSWEYFEILYSIIKDIRQKHPDVYFENCSGGGGRSDLGLLRLFDWLQVTDNFAPVAQLRTVYGMTVALCPEQVLSIYGAHMRHQADGDFICRSGLIGRPEFSGVADKIEHINQNWLYCIKNAFCLYKDHIRPILSKSLIFHHTPLEKYMEYGNFLVIELAAENKSKSIIELFRLEGSTESRFTVYPKGIDKSCAYSLYSDNDKTSIVLSGYEICQHGITVDIPGTLMSEVIILDEV